MAFRGHCHFWQTLPGVNFISVVIEADLPRVGPRAEREHWKRVAQVIQSHLELHIVRGPRPHQEPIIIEKGAAVMAFVNRCENFNRELNCGGGQLGKGVGIAAAWLEDSPIDEAGFAAGAAVASGTVAVAAGHGGFVRGDDFVGGAVEANGAVVDPEDTVAEAANLIELMGNEDDGAAGAGDVAHFAEAFLLEVEVADGENLIDEENFRLEMGGDGERQADVHAGGVVLDGRVDESFQFGEGDDFIELALDFRFPHSQNGSGEKSILPPRQLRMESSTHFQQGTDTSVNLCPAFRWPRNS